MATISNKFMVVSSLLDTQHHSTSICSTNDHFLFDSLALPLILDAVDWIVVAASLDSFQRRNILMYECDSVNKQNKQLMNR